MTRPEAKDITFKAMNNFVGSVSWCITAPQGIGWQTHKFTILDAIQLAINMIDAAGGLSGPNMRLVVGKQWATVIYILPQFRLTDGHTSHAGSLSRIGILDDLRIEWDSRFDDGQAVLAEGARKVKMWICEATV